MPNWWEEEVNSEDELIDRVACLGNGAKFTWSDKDAEEMRGIARNIIANVRRFDAKNVTVQ